MPVTVKTTWLCDVCKDYRNKGSSKHCNSCGALRKKSRYGILLDGVYYLCHIYSLKHTQLMSVYQVMPPSDHVMRVTYPSDADVSYDVVCTMIRRALEPAPIKAQEKINDSEKEGSSVSPAKEDSLFQRVMEEGKGLAYDSKIGRFVPSDTIDNTRIKKQKVKSALEAVNTDLNYVKFMAQEKRVMKKVVDETIVLRKKQEGDGLETANFQRSIYKPCSLCELEMPEESLLGEVSFVTVSRWRQERNAPIPKSDHRFSSTNLYNSAPLCIFCMQFFDGEIGSAIERGAQEIKAERDTPKILFNASAQDLTQIRPVSSIGRSIEISNLKMRSIKKNGMVSIETSSSVSVLEVKAKTAASISKVRLT